MRVGPRGSLYALVLLAGAAVPLAAQSLTPEEQATLDAWYRRTTERTRDGTWGIAIATMNGTVLWSVNPGQEMIPASTAKVFTTGFARARVGGDATLATRVVGKGSLENGRWKGRWAIEVGGDPSFERPDRHGPTLLELARQLAANGVRTLEGPLTLTSRTGPAGAAYPSVWSQDFQGQLYAPPVGPVTLHENTISVTFRPGRAVGSAPTIERALPNGVERMVRIQARTVAGSRNRLSLAPEQDGTWTLTGTVGIRAKRPGLSAVAHDPTSVMAYAWAAALERAGIRWEKRGTPVQAGLLATSKVLASVESAPLDTLASEINRRSLNIGAELMLQWGAGSQTEGPELLTEHVKQVVGPAARIHMVDGSGLSEQDRVSPLTQVLYLARYPQAPGRERFPLLLPANGTGTLRRLRDGMSKGVVHAKTGTLDDVATLTGYLGRPDGVLVISLMFNGRRTHAARAAEWELFRLLGAEGVNLKDTIETHMGGTSTKGDE
jgi:D-alanyl-D-alanine carboxypeptidase/D-alanyl-D-alanine-endopeptidase (penicillin-binding protein 4)